MSTRLRLHPTPVEQHERVGDRPNLPTFCGTQVWITVCSQCRPHQTDAAAETVDIPQLLQGGGECGISVVIAAIEILCCDRSERAAGTGDLHTAKRTSSVTASPRDVPLSATPMTR